MDIYPIHLRKKRIDYNKSSFNVEEMAKIKIGFEQLFKDLDHLKQHLNYMEKKYKTKDAEI
jgi:hypothetical protein